jgi:putative transposase
MKPQAIICENTRVTYHGVLGLVLETPKPGEDVLVELEGADCIARIKQSELTPLQNGREFNEGKSLESYSRTEWFNAEERAVMCRMIASSTKISRAIAAAAKELDISTKTMRYWWQRYCEDPRTSTLIDKKPGRKPGSRFLAAQQEAIIDEELQSVHLVDQKPDLSATTNAIEARCHLLDIPAPSGSTIRRRMQALHKGYVLIKRHGRKRYCERFRPVPNHLAAKSKMEIVEIDHTLADVILVSDDALRLPLGRPWITLAVCVATRMVVGVYVSFEAPSAVSLAMCILSMLMPKEQIVSHWGLVLHADWLGSGTARENLLDNGKEMHGIGMQRGCAEYGMSLRYRPVRTPHWGGHIERLIGTMMGRLRLIPGATQRDVRERDNKKVEAQACMTLDEFRQWLITEITTQYHQKVHRQLDTTPNQKWKELAGDEPPVKEWTEEEMLRCFVHFLPYEEHPITRTGIEHRKLRYWDDRLIPFIADGNEYDIRYDPRDIRRVYFVAPTGEVITVRCTEDKPPMSFEEWKRAKGEALEQGTQAIDWIARSTGFVENRALVANSSAKQRKAHRAASRLRERCKDTQTIPQVVPAETAQPNPKHPEIAFTPKAYETVRIDL